MLGEVDGEGKRSAVRPVVCSNGSGEGLNSQRGRRSSWHRRGRVCTRMSLGKATERERRKGRAHGDEAELVDKRRRGRTP